MAIDEALINSLKAALSGVEILTTDSEKFEQSLKRWSDSAEKRASAVVLPRSAEEVSATILFAGKHALDIAVCGGGHSCKGSSSSDGGIVIDLSKMRNVVVSSEEQTLAVDGGCLWVDVDSAAARHGLATVGGTVNHTGVGGLILGGGYGWLSGQYGLVVDNLLSMEVVLANGRIMTVSEKENPDLFFALRGAGQCFGVVTKFIIKAFPQTEPVWAGLLIFSPEDVEKVIDFANQLAKDSDGKSAMQVGITAPTPLGPSAALLGVVFYNGPKEEAESLFAPVTQDIMPLLNTTASIPYEAVNTLVNEMTAHGGRRTLKGTTTVAPLSAALFRDLMEDVTQFVTDLPEAGGSLVIFEIISPKKIISVPNTAMAFANRGEYYNCVVTPKWQNLEHDEYCRQWSRDVAAKISAQSERTKREHSLKLEMEGVGEYGNYDGLDLSAKKIFGPNYERLINLKTVYDPNNVFNKAFDLRPALRN
ncbi:MAG: hypothetical protein M4579_002129 [Chaenotheca gracillima]|nr:MAG: hypothetical protein M4579_002129 [Chaenotheca gracillima]